MKKIVFISWLIGSAVWGWEPLLSTTQVAASINDPKVVLVDVSEGDMYTNKGHLHGAVHTHLAEWRTAVEKHFLVKSPNDIQQVMRRLGINSDSKVILYSHLDTPKDLLTSSYIFWAMKLHGLKNISLMNGGFKAWSKENRFSVHDETKVAEGNFTAVLNPNMVADLSYVRQNVGKRPMIDARPAENYFGIAKSDGVARYGHIEGAMSYFWMYSVTPDLSVKSIDELKTIFTKGFDLSQGEEIILYCTGGLETSFNYFVLNALLGYTNVRLYDGSMREWGNRTDTPMVQYKWENYRPVTEVIP